MLRTKNVGIISRFFSISVERFQWRALKKIWRTYLVNRKKTRYTQFEKITEQLRSYQVQRDILVDEQFSHYFSSSFCFLFAITNGMVKVLVEGCFGLDLFDLTNISNSVLCFLATWREKLENDPIFPT